MVAWFYNLGESTLPVEWFGGVGNSVANPVQYFLIPFVLMWLLGAKPAELGLGKGHKVWLACLVLIIQAVLFISLANGTSNGWQTAVDLSYPHHAPNGGQQTKVRINM